MSGATSPEAETIVRQTETINRLMGNSATQIERVQRQLDSAYASQQRYQQAQTAITTAVERGRITQERANQLLDLAQQKYQQAGQAAQSFATANDNAARSNRNFGGVIGQAGFQVQDFAVQIASGQSALTAFIQQGSQLAGAFGTGGILVGAGLAIAGIIVQLMGAKTATEALNEAIERQGNIYSATTSAAERYREGLAREQQEVARLSTFYGTLTQDMRAVERIRLSLSRNALLQTQRERVNDATSRLGGLATGPGGEIAGMPFAESSMAIIGGAGALAPGLREAATAVQQFREQGNFTQESISALIVRLNELAQANAGSSRAIIRQRDALLEAAPQLLESQRALEQNAAANAALDGNARGAAAALSGVGAAAARQLAPLRDLVRDLDKVNVELAALRTGGIAGLEQAQRARTVMELAQRDLDQDIAARVARGASAADARAQAMDGTPMADRIAEAMRLVEGQRQVEETTRRLREEAAERERAQRRSAAGGRAGGRREDRLEDRSLRERDQLIASLDEEAAANIRLEESLRRIDEARKRNQLSEQEAADLSQRVRDRREQDIVRANDKSQLYAEDTKRLAELNRELGDIIGGAFQDMVREGKSFEDTLKNIERQLLRLGDKYLLAPLLDQISQLALSGLGGGGKGGAGGGLGGLGGILSSLAGSGVTSEVAGTGAAKLAEVALTAAVAHRGGLVGDPGLPTRAAPAEVFLDAPRFHSGGMAGGMRFASDEVPAILRRGEMVLTERQQAAVANRGSINQTVIVKAEDPGAFNRTRGQMAQVMRRDLARASRSA